MHPAPHLLAMYRAGGATLLVRDIAQGVSGTPGRCRMSSPSSPSAKEGAMPASFFKSKAKQPQAVSFRHPVLKHHKASPHSPAVSLCTAM